MGNSGPGTSSFKYDHSYEQNDDGSIDIVLKASTWGPINGELSFAPSFESEDYGGEIITNSIVFNQAENRMHMQNAIMVMLAGKM